MGEENIRGNQEDLPHTSANIKHSDQLPHSQHELIQNVQIWLKTLEEEPLLRQSGSIEPVDFRFGEVLTSTAYPTGRDGFERDFHPILERHSTELTTMLGQPCNRFIPTFWHAAESPNQSSGFAFSKIETRNVGDQKRSYYNGCTLMMFQGMTAPQEQTIRHELGHAWTMDALPNIVGIQEIAALLLEADAKGSSLGIPNVQDSNGITYLKGSPAYGNRDNANVDAPNIGRIWFNAQLQEFLSCVGGKENAIRILKESKKKAGLQPKDAELGVLLPTLDEWLETCETVVPGSAQQLRQSALFADMTSESFIACMQRKDWGVVLLAGAFVTNPSAGKEPQTNNVESQGKIVPRSMTLRFSNSQCPGIAKQSVQGQVKITPRLVQRAFETMIGKPGVIPPDGFTIFLSIEGVKDPLQLKWNNDARTLLLEELQHERSHQ